VADKCPLPYTGARAEREVGKAERPGPLFVKEIHSGYPPGFLRIEKGGIIK